MWLMAAAHAAAAHGAAAEHGGGDHGGEHASFHTGSLLHPLYSSGILDQHVLPEEVLISLIMMALIGLACILMTRRLDIRRPSKTQAALELIVSGLNNMVTGLIGPDGRRYLPYVGTLFITIFILNVAGVIPMWKSPTANLHVTLGLALTTFVYVQYQGIRGAGLKGYLSHFVGEPVWLAPLNIPLHIVGELARPVSLCFRLFGNIFGEDTVIAILILIGAMIYFPAQFFMLPFAVFTSFLQAMVFTMLTCIYIASFVAHHEEEHGHGHGHGGEHPVIQSPLPAPPA